LVTTSLLTVLAGSTVQARPLRPAQISQEIVVLARRWATARNLPLPWVLATIYLESRGDPNAHRVSDRENSYGLMQVNAKAHLARLIAAGVSPADLYNPNTNIEWGTLILREAFEKATRSGAAPIDVATRLVYNTGGVPSSPQVEKVAAWSEALARTRALV
jgi:soluble lytic murein transglycosylase-like protein